MNIKPEIIQIFNSPQIAIKFRNEIGQKFRQFKVQGFNLIIKKRFHFLKDSLPLALLIQVPFHSKIDLTCQLPKEMILESMKGTPLEGFPFPVFGEVVQSQF